MAHPNRLEDRVRLLEMADGLPLELVRIPGGTFRMGSPEDEPGRWDSEGPQHAVTVPSFLMGRYPVTQAQWRAVAELPLGKRSLDPDPAYFKGADRPVEPVSWDEAVEFCDRLAQQTKRPYRLPSEAEWEYACRAGTTTPFHGGPTLTPAVANYNGRYPAPSADGPEGGSRGQTTPVDHFGVANAVGLCDLHGNVFEWRQDHWHDTYDGARSDGRAWLSPGEPNGCLYDGALPDAWLCPGKRSRRVTRGGAWSVDPRVCRSAHRHWSEAISRCNFIGFRVACSAPRTWESLKSGGYPP